MNNLIKISLFLMIGVFFNCCEQSIESTIGNSTNIYGSLSGYVKDNISDRSLPNSLLYLGSGSDTIYSDTSGYFIIENLKEGIYELHCHPLGFSPDSQIVIVIGDSSKEVNFWMEHDDLFVFTDSLSYNLVNDNVLVNANITNYSNTSRYLLFCSSLRWQIEKLTELGWSNYESPGCFWITMDQWVEFLPSQSLEWLRLIFEKGKYRVYFPYSETGQDEVPGTLRIYTNEFSVY